jgi:hypothetical protein
VRESTFTWAQVPARPVLDPDLSAKARGVYATLTALDLSGPTSVAKLVERFPDGEASIKTALTELESRGYLTREVLRDDAGRRTGMRYTLHPEPTAAPEKNTA